MRYLIIDDSENIRQLIKQTIKSSNDIFFECSDGEDGVEAYSSFKPDFVLMDIQMEKMDGLKATRKIIENYPDAKIIIITEYDSQPFRIAADKAGAISLVSKENLIELKKYLSK